MCNTRLCTILQKIVSPPPRSRLYKYSRALPVALTFYASLQVQNPRQGLILVWSSTNPRDSSHRAVGQGADPSSHVVHASLDSPSESSALAETPVSNTYAARRRRKSTSKNRLAEHMLARSLPLQHRVTSHTSPPRHSHLPSPLSKSTPLEDSTSFDKIFASIMK